MIGSFDRQREMLPESAGVESFGQMLALSSAISMNSSAMIFLTTLGGILAAGLYGPRDWSKRDLGDPSVDTS